MLAVVDKSLAKLPEGLIKSPASSSEENAVYNTVALLQHFCEGREGGHFVSLGSAGGLAYHAKMRNSYVFRLYATVDKMFCLFEGRIDNLSQLKKYYGLNMKTNEATLVIEIYRTIRDRGPYPAEKLIRDIEGRFAFVLYDMHSKCIFVAVDNECTVPFYWGVDSIERLILSDDAEFLKKACGKSFSFFPKGCFYTSTKGLRSYDQPLYELKAVPWVDSQGDVYGDTYEVDLQTRKPTRIPRVDSDFKWSSEF